ncbi:MAG: 23S rRNA (adenine(1618)-N(6))-methyltransferase RlmF [Bacteroidota bacterium]
MKKKPNSLPVQKGGLHTRNKHQDRYNFEELTSACPDLAQFVSVNQFKTETIDFTNADAVKTLNRALLKQFYGIDQWDIPKNYLCPPIPGRADYIHNLADVLSASNGNLIPKGKSVTVFDIGTGANCIYPLLGHKEYGWSFIASETDALAMKVAKQIVESNDLSQVIDCRFQSNSSFIFKGILKPNELIDITVCNPPFHASAAEAQSGSQKKWKNLGYKKTEKPVLNFGGQTNELWCKGGEVAFISKMVDESAGLKEQCLWFTSLVSKSENLPAIYGALKRVGAVTVKTITMSQGNKISRMVCWSFLTETQQIQWSLKRWKS